MIHVARIAFFLATFIAASVDARSADFDYYVLSLSWSPTWCARNGDRRDAADQCENNPRGLVVHGLWPQNERGWPQSCPSNEPDRVPSALARGYLDIFPSVGLIGHEWRKHGTCSGLSQRDYLSLVRSATRRILLPPLILDAKQPRRLSADTLKSALQRANRGLGPDDITLACEADQLAEIRICLDKSLNFRSCSANDRSSCRKSVISLPAFDR